MNVQNRYVGPFQRFSNFLEYQGLPKFTAPVKVCKSGCNPSELESSANLLLQLKKVDSLPTLYDEGYLHLYEEKIRLDIIFIAIKPENKRHFPWETEFQNDGTFSVIELAN